MAELLASVLPEIYYYNLSGPPKLSNFSMIRFFIETYNRLYLLFIPQALNSRATNNNSMKLSVPPIVITKLDEKYYGYLRIVLV